MHEDFSRPKHRKPIKIDRMRSGFVRRKTKVQKPPAVPKPTTRHPKTIAGLSKAAIALAKPARITAESFDHSEELIPEQEFRTPEQISKLGRRTTRTALMDDAALEALVLPELPVELEPESFKDKLLRVWNSLSKQKKLLGAGALAAMVIASGAIFELSRTKNAPAAVNTAPAKAVVQPGLPEIASPLTGAPVSAEQRAKPVIGAMIENSPAARPQSGLNDAGVVFEAIAEAGITRFLALYQEAEPETIGPVRSARPYFLDWAMAFDASYAHVGGSPEALQRIIDIGVKDLDQFYNAGAYYRTSDRYAPHNMYTSMGALNQIAQAKGYTKSAFTPFKRKVAEPGKTPTAKSINIGISSAGYNVRYDFDPVTNSFKRSMGGGPHTDMASGAQLEPKVVIVLAMPYSLMDDGYHSQYQTVGTGKMVMFQDGVPTAGSWSKAGTSAQFEFKDSTNAPMLLNPGQTWITMVDDISKVTYVPQ